MESFSKPNIEGLTIESDCENYFYSIPLFLSVIKILMIKDILMRKILTLQLPVTLGFKYVCYFQIRFSILVCSVFFISAGNEVEYSTTQPGLQNCTITFFENSTEVKVYDCSFLGLTEIPRFQENCSAEEIYLYNNMISNFPNESAFPSSLKILDLSNNLLTNFTEHAFDGLTNLHVLKLYNNSLLEHASQQPVGMFEDLVSLQHLDLQMNAYKDSNKCLPRSLTVDCLTAMTREIQK